MQPVNGRRPSGPPQRIRRDYFPRQSPNENTEIISFVHESWNKVQKDFRNNSQYGPGAPNVMYYTPPESNNRLNNFEPFDLESWWGKQTVQNCQNRSP